MDQMMKSRFCIFRRGTGIYFCEDRGTGLQHSLRTRDKNEAERLLHARNEAQATPGLAIHIAKAYLASADPALAKRTWRYVAEELIKTKHDANQDRWQRAIKDKAFAKVLDLPLIETRADHFLAALSSGTVSTNVFLRRLHNFAHGLGWLLCQVLPPKQWPRVVHKAKRAISHSEHVRIIARESNPERRAYYELLWELGGSQGDIARLNAEDVDWNTRTIAYFRAKTGHPARICFDAEVKRILRLLPAAGPLFPYLRGVRASDRATEFKQRCQLLGIKGVTLHSYRYSWAERAREAGYPERAAQEVLGHGSKAVHRAYRNKSHCILTIDTAKLLEKHANRTMLCHINSGSTIYTPQPRGRDTFKTIGDYPFETWRKKRGAQDAVVELVIDYSVPDISDFVLRVDERRGADLVSRIY
jgi:integrase